MSGKRVDVSDIKRAMQSAGVPVELIEGMPSPMEMMSPDDQAAIEQAFDGVDAHPDQSEAIEAWLAQETPDYDRLKAIIEHMSARERLCDKEVDAVYSILSSADKLPDDNKVKETLFVLLIDGITEHKRADVLELVRTTNEVAIYISEQVAVGLIKQLAKLHRESIELSEEATQKITLTLIDMLLINNASVASELLAIALANPNKSLINLILKYVSQYKITPNQSNQLFPIQFVISFMATTGRPGVEDNAERKDIVRLLLSHPFFNKKLTEVNVTGLTPIHTMLKNDQLCMFLMAAEFVALEEVIDKQGRNLLFFALENEINISGQSLAQRLFNSTFFHKLVIARDRGGKTILHHLAGQPIKNSSQFLDGLLSACQSNNVDVHAIAAIKDNKGVAAIDVYKDRIKKVVDNFDRAKDVRQLLDKSYQLQLVASAFGMHDNLSALMNCYAAAFMHHKLKSEHQRRLQEALDDHIKKASISINDYKVNEMPLYWAAMITQDESSDQRLIDRCKVVATWCEKYNASPLDQVDNTCLLDVAMGKSNSSLIAACLSKIDQGKIEQSLIRRVIDWYVSQTESSSKPVTTAVRQFASSIDELHRRNLFIDFINQGKFSSAQKLLPLFSRQEIAEMQVSKGLSIDHKGVVMLEHVVNARIPLLKSKASNQQKNKRALKTTLDIFKVLCRSGKVPADLAVSIVENQDKALASYCDFDASFVASLTKRLTTASLVGFKQIDEARFNTVIRESGVLFIAISRQLNEVVLWLLTNLPELATTTNPEGKLPSDLLTKRHPQEIHDLLKPKTKSEPVPKDVRTPTADEPATVLNDAAREEGVYPPIESNPTVVKSKPKSKTKSGLPPISMLQGEYSAGMAYDLGDVADQHVYLCLVNSDVLQLALMCADKAPYIDDQLIYEKRGANVRLTFSDGKHIKVPLDVSRWLALMPDVGLAEEVEAAEGAEEAEAVEKAEGIEAAEAVEDVEGAEELEAAEVAEEAESPSNSDSSGYSSMVPSGSKPFMLNGEFFSGRGEWHSGIPEVSDDIWLALPDGAKLPTEIHIVDKQLFVKVTKVEDVVTFGLVFKSGKTAVLPSAIQYTTLNMHGRDPQLVLRVSCKDELYHIQLTKDQSAWLLPESTSRAGAPAFHPQPRPPMPEAPSNQGCPPSSLFRPPVMHMQPIDPRAAYFMQQQQMAMQFGMMPFNPYQNPRGMMPPHPGLFAGRVLPPNAVVARPNGNAEAMRSLGGKPTK